MDPGVLYGNKATIEARVMDVIKKARSCGVRYCDDGIIMVWA